MLSDMQEDIRKVETWSDQNHMALHPQKSKFMMVTTRQKRQNISSLKKIKIYDTDIEEVNSHKVLGLSIDNNLSWTVHISALIRKLSKKVFQLNRIKHLVDQHTRKLFFHAYLQPDFDYASTVWDKASKKCLKPLESMYRRSIKLILLKSSSVLDKDYKTLNILPLHLRCKFNKAVFLYKIVNGLAPSYLSEKLHTVRVRGKDRIILPRPRTDLYMTSLTYSGGGLWNDIPDYIKLKLTLASFKASYNAFLLNQL